MDGDLQQEFRELDLLDTITDLRYKKILPTEFASGTRWAAIDGFRTWRIKNDIGKLVASDEVFETKLQKPDNGKYQIQTITALKKRKNKDNTPLPKKKTHTHRTALITNAPWLAPVGLIWDSNDHSCTYNSLTFILYWLWYSNKPHWNVMFKGFSPCRIDRWVLDPEPRRSSGQPCQS
jgi:hypothetical protein